MCLIFNEFNTKQLVDEMSRMLSGDEINQTEENKVITLYDEIGHINDFF
jgi:hypothetical protein